MDTQWLMGQAAKGDAAATNELFSLYKSRLRRMVALRLDKRLAARIDPSDIVQDTMAEAHRRLPGYFGEQQELPFYPWLRAIAWNKLIDAYRRHVLAERRSVSREAMQLDLSGESKAILVNQLAANSSVTEAYLRQELHERLRQAIDQLPSTDRELIALKHLEGMTFEEAAAVLQLTNEAVRSRYRRSIQRLYNVLHRERGEA